MLCMCMICTCMLCMCMICGAITSIVSHYFNTQDLCEVDKQLHIFMNKRLLYCLFNDQLCNCSVKYIDISARDRHFSDIKFL